MPTKSFFKQVIIKNSQCCEALVNALEDAVDKKSSQTAIPKPTWAKAEDIKKMIFARR